MAIAQPIGAGNFRGVGYSIGAAFTAARGGVTLAVFAIWPEGTLPIYLCDDAAETIYVFTGASGQPK